MKLKGNLCRALGHKWVWVSGWIDYECSRCGRTDEDEHREFEESWKEKYGKAER